jgi:hypothetical protein
MSDDRIIQSKRNFRRQLTARPIAEKLRTLDLLRERALAIQRASGSEKKAIASAHRAQK